MNAGAAPAGPAAGHALAGVVRPLCWRLSQPPPAAALSQPGGSAAAPAPSPHGLLPLLLLLDRRDQAPPARSGCADPRSPAGFAPDAAERERAARYRRPEDRERFLLGRAALRLLLGAWLACDPASLRFRYGPQGKPALDRPEGAAPHFNLAHSGDLILLALHPALAVGVDVERHRPDLAWQPIAARFLPPADLADLRAQPPAAQAAGFLQLWCRLEARLKASGEGLAGLERLRRRGDAEAGLAGGALWDVAVPAGYGAAVALAPPA